jgi:hypothetical protein
VNVMKLIRQKDIIPCVDTKEAGRRGGESRAANMTPEQRVEAASEAGRARVAKQTPEQRSALASKAAKARWAKARKRKPK